MCSLWRTFSCNSGVAQSLINLYAAIVQDVPQLSTQCASSYPTRVFFRKNELKLAEKIKASLNHVMVACPLNNARIGDNVDMLVFAFKHSAV